MRSGTPSDVDPRTQVVWFKRDLRIRDHAPLLEAAANGPVLCLYLYEPSLLRSAEWDASHSQFIAESLQELSERLASLGGRLVTRMGEAVEVLERLRQESPFRSLWSHEETGNDITFRRDRDVADWCRDRGVIWTQIRQDGVARRLLSRDGWSERWDRVMSHPVLPPPLRIESPRGLDSEGILGPVELGLGPSSKTEAQRGGEGEGRWTLERFLEVRALDYRRGMSSPVTGWDSCSRISPYLTWGCLSMRSVHHAWRERMATLAAERSAGLPVDRRWFDSLRSFGSRLRWHCHFIQKLEDEPRIEFENFVRTFDGLRESFTESDEGRRQFEAWCTGRTGYPMVDASMRCAQATGWLNFRMRAMLMSFASHHLGLHWRPTAVFLARHFLDFEAGIHFSQAQMQSGTTGINTVRIYSPAKQAIDQDPDGVFIRRWVPELSRVPLAHLARPETMSASIQDLSGCVLGRDYPRPVVDHATAYRQARERLQAIRRLPSTRSEARRVLVRHGSRKGSGFRHLRAELEERGLTGRDRIDPAASAVRQLEMPM